VPAPAWWGDTPTTRKGAEHPPIRGLTPSSGSSRIPRFLVVENSPRHQSSKSKERRGFPTMRQTQIVKRPTRVGRDPLDLRTPTGRQLNF